MRKHLPKVLLILAAVVGIAFLFLRPRTEIPITTSPVEDLVEPLQANDSSPPERVDRPRPQAPTVVDRPIVLMPGANSILREINGASSEATDDIDILQNVLRQYRMLLRESPVGADNMEITARLLGSNAKRLAIIPPTHAVINQKGEIIDRWGSPYFFHPVSEKLIEIISAGPDKQLWTEDDIAVEETSFKRPK